MHHEQQRNHLNMCSVGCSFGDKPLFDREQIQLAREMAPNAENFHTQARILNRNMKLCKRVKNV